jgi:D-aminoacyl-tRNA deacylase
VRAVVQRVTCARVTVGGRVTGEIRSGIVILLGIGRRDSPQSAAYLADKIANLRIFADPAGKMNLSLIEINGGALVVSQFTLYGDTRGGRRPSFVDAAPPEQAKSLYEEFLRDFNSLCITVQTGAFGEHMEVEMVNDGPVTILLDSEKSL